MKIHTLWAVRISSPDEPELVTAWDEYSVDANPEGWHKDVAEGLDSWGSDLETHRFIDIEIPDKAVFDAFGTPTIPAEGVN
jgi:hypothetical protein